MSDYNLTNLNLNLLRVLSALLEERSVSKAAENLCLTQPAVSHALNKLRELFDDELFIRCKTGMEITFKAQSLAPQVKQVMQDIEQLFFEEISFHPVKSSHKFKLALIGEYGDYVILPKLLAWVEQNNSQLRFEIFHTKDEDAVRLLEQDDVDVIIGNVYKYPSTIDKHLLNQSQFVCLVGKHHPLLKKKKVTLEQYLKYPHVQSRFHLRMSQPSYIDMALQKKKLKRHIRLSLDTRQGLPIVLENSQMIATLSKQHAFTLCQSHDLAIFDCPIELPTILSHVYWNKRTGFTPEVQWLIDQIVTATKPESE